MLQASVSGQDFYKRLGGILDPSSQVTELRGELVHDVAIRLAHD